MNTPCYVRLAFPTPALALCLLVSWLFLTTSVQADTLSPQRIQELTDLGAQIADREKAMKEAEQQLQNPNLSPADRERLTKEVGDHRDFIKNTKDAVAAKGTDQKRVLDRAIEARHKQHQLREAEAKAKADPGDKKAQRTANRLKVELQNDYKDLGTLPPLASAAMPGTGTAGQAVAAAVLLDDCKKQLLLSSSTPAQETPDLFGNRLRPLLHSALRASLKSRPDSSPLHRARVIGAGGARPQSDTSYLRFVNDPLPPSGAMTPGSSSGAGQRVNFSLGGNIQYKRPGKGGMKSKQTEQLSSETSTSITLEFTGKNENVWSLCAGYRLPWNPEDRDPPVLDYAKPDDTYQIRGHFTWPELQYRQNTYGNLKIHASYRDADGDLSFGTTNLPVPQLPAIPDLPSLSLSPEESMWPVPAGDVAIDDRLQYIKRFTPETDIPQLSLNLEQAGLHGVDTWTAWRNNPLGSDFFVYYLDDLSHIDRFKIISGRYLDIFEPNEDRGGAPAPSLDPSYWPQHRGQALPHWTISLSPAGAP
jgi:hypothetical protein